MRHPPLAVAILGLLAAACVPRGKYLALQRERDELLHRYEAVNEASDGVRMELSELQARLAQMEADEAAAPPSFFDDLLREFQPLVDAQDLEVVVYPDRTVLGFDDGLTFPSGSARLDPGADEVVRALAELVRQHPDRQFVIEGHTDRVPIRDSAYASNWELGAARAVAVVEALVRAGADPDQLAAASYSATDPLLDEVEWEGLVDNRRVEITVQPTLDEIPGEEQLLDSVPTVLASAQEGVLAEPRPRPRPAPQPAPPEAQQPPPEEPEPAPAPGT